MTNQLRYIAIGRQSRTGSAQILKTPLALTREPPRLFLKHESPLTHLERQGSIPFKFQCFVSIQPGRARTHAGPGSASSGSQAASAVPHYPSSIPPPAS